MIMETLQIETSLLKCLTFRREFYEQVQELISAEVFATEQSQEYYRLLADTYNQVPAHSGYDILQGALLENGIDMLYLSGLAKDTAPLLYAPRYLMQIFKDYVDRTVSRMQLEGKDPEEIISFRDEAYNRFDLTMGVVDGKRITPLMSATESVEGYFARKGNTARIPRYPLRLLNEYTGGLLPGQLITIGARTGIGKTTFALAMMVYAAQDSFRSMYYSTEMTHVRLSDKIICNLTGINPRDFKQGSLNPAQESEIESCLDRISTMEYSINDSTSVTVEGVVAKAKEVHEKEGLDLLFVDYLQQLNTSGKKESRQVEVADISRKLKQLALELQIPVVAVTQLNRGVENRADQRPRSSDIRESGAVEQDSDIVMLISRNEDDPFAAEIIIDKNREGECGVVEFRYANNFTGIANI